MKVDQKNTTNNNTLSVRLTHPPNAPNIDTPPPVRLAIIPGTDVSCPERKTFYTKIAQKKPTNTNTIPIPPPPPPNITNIEPPPPPDRQSDDLSGTTTVPGSNYFEH